MRNDKAGLTLAVDNAPNSNGHSKPRAREKRTLVAKFRAYTQLVSGPNIAGDFKLTLGTNSEFKDAMWALTNHPGEYFEVEIRTVHLRPEDNDGS